VTRHAAEGEFGFNDCLLGRLFRPQTRACTDIRRVTRYVSRVTSGVAVPITVKVASPLRSYASGAATVNAEGATVADALADLEQRFPGMRFRMIDEHNRIRQHIRLFVNTTAVKTLQEPIRDGDTLHLICALSGG